MRRIFFAAVAGIAAACVMLTACSTWGEGESSGNPSVVSSASSMAPSQASSQAALIPSRYYSLVVQRAGYHYLDGQAAQGVYELACSRADKITLEKDKNGLYPMEEIRIEGEKITETEISLALRAFRNDNPQVFWIANRYSYYYSGEDTVIRLYSYLSPSQRDDFASRLNRVVTQVLENLPDGMSELDREIYLFETVTEKATYDTSAAQDAGQWLPYTAYGALVTGSAVCEGYAKAVQLLAGYMGLESRLAIGESRDVAHMWNVIRIDGKWYHLDATWSDGSLVRYDYFNVTDHVVSTDHLIYPEIGALSDDAVTDLSAEESLKYNFPLPECTSEDANYFQVRGLVLKTLSNSGDDDAIAALVSAAQNWEESIAIYISAPLNFDVTVQRLFQSVPYKFEYYVKRANEMLDATHQINYSQVQYVTAKAVRGITVKLSY